MDKRVFGVLGIVSRMSNWNADFSGYPKTISDGTVFGSDKAFKYPMKKLWEEKGKNVLYIKSLRLDRVTKKNKETGEVQLIPRTLKERYEQLFNVELSSQIDRKDILINLFNCVDVKNFGATFAEEGNNIAITGAVQIGQGFNKYENSNAEEQQILSPFRVDSKSSKTEEGEEAKSSTLGTKIVSDEAHYFYPFTINPKSYSQYHELDVTEGYSEEDYIEFKNTSLVAATAYSTNAKIGCENEFALFIETKDDLYLPNLTPYIEFIKGNEKNTIKIEIGEIVNTLSDSIYSIEIYYNPYTTVIKDDIDKKKVFNLFTKDEIKM